MSFDFPSQPQVQQRRGGGCSRFIFMAVILFAAWYMFSGGAKRPNKPVPEADGGREGGFFDQERSKREKLKDDIFGDGTVNPNGQATEPARKMPSTGHSGAGAGWEMEDVDQKKNNNDFSNGSRLPAPRKSGSPDDWSIGDVNSPRAEAEPVRRMPSTKKSSNDWSLEEVEAK